jgi:uncharacterized membrane protein YdjX (TVP38/TMEM64 family)
MMASRGNAEPQGTPDADGTGVGRNSPPRTLLRLAPLAAIALILLLFYALELGDYLSLDMLRGYQGSLDAFVGAHSVMAPALYLLVYVATVAISFPVAGFLTIAGGFLFGAAFGAVLAWAGATLGATIVFLVARTSFGDLLARRAGPRTDRLRLGFQRDGFSYLLFLRLVPLFPFWLVNLAAALFHMRLAPYAAATAIGILPATFVFAYFGEGLETTLAERPASLQILIALLLLGMIALGPAAVRRWRSGRGSEPGPPDGPSG